VSLDDGERPLDPTTGWVREHLHRYVATDGENGHEWRGVPTLLLTTRGRRSGNLRRTPLIYGRAGQDYVVVASQGGRPQHPGWFHNLRAEPEVTIQVKADEMPARARVAEGEERARLWGMMAAIWPAYDDYQARTEREIPVVVLETAGR
jgi:deazaflavin-dependent oxidoreductase (nitroreductase family)